MMIDEYDMVVTLPPGRANCSADVLALIEAALEPFGMSPVRDAEFIDLRVDVDAAVVPIPAIRWRINGSW